MSLAGTAAQAVEASGKVKEMPRESGGSVTSPSSGEEPQFLAQIIEQIF
jgi:hypothetical protein